MNFGFADLGGGSPPRCSDLLLFYFKIFCFFNVFNTFPTFFANFNMFWGKFSPNFNLSLKDWENLQKSDDIS